jgi:hypothetical protein
MDIETLDTLDLPMEVVDNGFRSTITPPYISLEVEPTTTWTASV